MALAATVACAPRGPVIDTTADPPAVGGTIAGTVRGAAPGAALSGRKVTAIDVATGARYDASTATNGGYTIKVPVGKYRLDVELRSGEDIVERPEDTEINNGDLDADRDFVIGVRR